MRKWNAEELRMMGAAKQEIDKMPRYRAASKGGQHKHASQLSHARCDRNNSAKASLQPISLRYRDQVG